MQTLFRVPSKFVFVVVLLTSAPLQADPLPGIWIWAGRLPGVTKDFGTLYVLQGYFWIDQGFRYDFQGPRPQESERAGLPLVLTYRLQSLVPAEMVASRYQAHARAWRKRGGNVRGIQIDYDCPTSRLSGYSRWLERLKKTLRGEPEISVTGLGDWLVSAEPGDLEALFHQTEYVAFMMYHGRRQLDPVAPFTTALVRATAPFKLGLLKDQRNNPAFSDVRNAPGYTGDIQYILPEARK